MLGSQWTVTVAETTTDDPDLAKLAVSVAAPGDSAPIITLDGFRDRGTTTR